MTRLHRLLFAAAGFILAMTGAAALADLAVTYSSANARVIRLEFVPNQNGSVEATVCGITTSSPVSAPALPCKTISLPAGNAIAIEVQALATTDALSFWKSQNGL